MGIKNPHQSDNAKQHTRQYNSGQGIVDLRKWIAWVSNILDARRKNIKLSNKQKANLRKIKSKYNASSSSKLREIREKLYQQLKVSCARERKLKVSRKAKEENRQFLASQSNWLKNKEHVGRESDSKSMASMTDFENFWGEIWKKPENMNTEVWEQILTIMNKHIKVNSQEREPPNIKERDLKKVLKKIKPWGGTGWDQLAAFWWKKMSNIHTILLDIVINMFKEGKCPDWETLGRTILIGKKGKSMDKAENVRPITCLSVIYKIQSALVNIKLREHIFENKIWPFEQLGTLEGTLGAKEAILFDRYIVREARLYKRNLSVAWTDVRKAYDSLYQEFIIKMLQFIRVPEWITAWLKMAMSSWRTILQVKKGKNRVLSKEIAIKRGIFQGDSLSPTLFCLCFTVISYHIRDLKLGYTLGAPSKRHGSQMITHTLLMDDLKIYSTSHQLLEKVIKKATYVMEAIGLSLSLEKCAVLSTKAGRETSTNNLMIAQEKDIEGLNDGKSYMYLGMAQRSDCQEQIIKTTMLEEFFRRNKIIWQSLLSASNKVKAYSSLCV